MMYDLFELVTLWVRNVDMQKPLCAFHTLTVVSDDAEITTGGKNVTHIRGHNQLSQ